MLEFNEVVPRRNFPGIEDAIAELDQPDIVWFRGHVSTHQLVPSFLRLNRFRPHSKNAQRDKSDMYATEAASNLHQLITMHNTYFATPLLAWTQDLLVALFCALVRECNAPSVFVLDPISLNNMSGIGGIVELGCPDTISDHLGNPIRNLILPASPLAIKRASCGRRTVDMESIFTLHGQSARPLEEQCPECVRKVDLSGDEVQFAADYILSRPFGPQHQRLSRL